MSQVNVDTIRKSDGSLGTDIRVKNTSVYESDGGTSVTQNIVQSLTKAWCLFEGDGTAAITDSFNFGSITDNGTGDYSFAITNNMSSANYCVPCGTVKDTGGQTTNIAVDHDNPPSASVLRMLCVDDYTQAQRDGELQSFNVLGDLA